ncbi:MAG: hypothetical protein NC251_02360 [Lachnoclostridium sp.]|nr:hypothetical protein [Lachnospira sp.]MCM1247253.1 hypothetical protein [Lachnoclostridium sp.]
MTKSQILRENIENFEAVRENKMYPLRMNKLTEAFGDSYKLKTYGVVDADILLGKGFWAELEADYYIKSDEIVRFGSSVLEMHNNSLYITGGSLAEMQTCLKILNDKRRKGGMGMSYYLIKGEDDTVRTYVLVSYEVIPNEKTVIVRFSSIENSVTYELRPDIEFGNVGAICSSLQNKLAKAVASGYTIKISEDFARMYVMIGYETEDEFEMDRFTASKL